MKEGRKYVTKPSPPAGGQGLQQQVMDRKPQIEKDRQWIINARAWMKAWSIVIIAAFIGLVLVVHFARKRKTA